MDQEKFVSSFGKHTVPAELLRLVAFEATQGGKWFAESFELKGIDRSGLSTYSTDERFLSRLFPFAIADGTGSEYALWLAEESQSLEEAPVVGFGSEGGAQVVGCNIRDLLEILASDVEPMLDWDRVFYYVGDDHEASQGHDAYVEWLTDVLGRVPNRTADEVVLAAQQQYGARFDTWAKPYMPR